ncbi:MAG: DNA alkylation repair protein [Hyphomicrobiales bacterium]|nr:MAG: DNA alkylation repair protein [Hyphomicrobiales bacterium]
MPDDFKDYFNETLIRTMGRAFVDIAPEFPEQRFCQIALDDLVTLELKDRSNQIARAMVETLPDDFAEASAILINSLADEGAKDGTTGLYGWCIMPMAAYVEQCGMGNVPLALTTLRELTSRFSSEFSIRPFIITHEDEVMTELAKWVSHKNHHVRRLVSEGTRPRLPWGIQLKRFVADPAPVLALLEQLKDDDEEYVRRSVANNLNDIAKDHPDLVATIAKDWMTGASNNRKRLVRHGLRTLIKQGHAGALAALGYGSAEVELTSLTLEKEVVTLGGGLSFTAQFQSTAAKNQPLIIDFIIHHMKANGQTSPKVFKWKNVDLPAKGKLIASKNHPMRPITTRRYYAGTHRLEIIANGQVLGGVDFKLELP